MSKKKNKLEEKVIQINRISKTVKGGRIFSFSALIVLGNKKGLVGYGYGKAKEIPIAIKKAIKIGEKNLIKINIKNNTLQYPLKGYFNKSHVFMKPAKKGTGIIASKVMKAIFKVTGIYNVLAKSYFSSNPINVVKATINTLKKIETSKTIINKRGKFIVW